MTKILNYSIHEKLGETRSSIIFRAIKEGENGTCLIKEFKSTNSTQPEIARFRQEYETIKKIDIEGIIKTYEILDYENKIALVLEDFDGVSLKKFFKGQKINLELFLKIAEKLSGILGSLHKENIIHKDIKPDSILYNPKTGELKLVDFGISNEITHENNEVYNPQVIEGTLPYMSPEQTGRINRQMDYRTDMYSLGIILYELLAGNVPFHSKNPMEIIHFHIAVKANPLIGLDPSIPEVISNIIDKLLSKMPEDRYQNCFGLMNDFDECYKQLQSRGGISTFEIAQKDISPFFIVPQLLIGREKEIEILQNTIERIISSGDNNEVALVSGHPGIGKSAVIHEIQKSIVYRRGYFISGKYDQFRRDVPYSAIIQSFMGLVKQILIQSDEMIEEWKAQLLDVLGLNGKVITDIIPEIELIIGKQPDVPELGSEQNQNRFNYVFKNFISVLATRDHPLVLFLDDLQWMDLASLNLIELILSDNDLKCFLIIGSYRDTEVDDSHPLMMSMNKMKEKGVPINFIHLNILNEENVNEMISYFLRCDKMESLPLAKLVHEKTNGNPFSVNQFMKTLYDEKLLVLDSLSGWQWDMVRIKNMQITDNVVHLIAGKMLKLPERTLEVLKICACIGYKFDLEMVSKINNTSIQAALQEITTAQHEGMLRLLDDMYRFQHDGIQEAAYSLVSDDVKEKLHYRIGNVMLEKINEKNFQKEILYVVDQLNAGKSCIITEEERYNLAELNLRAGNKAKDSAAYESALIYFKTGIDLINFSDPSGKLCWEKEYHLSLSLYSDSTEAAYLNCKYNEMERLSEVVLENTKSLLDAVKVYEFKMRAYMAQNKLREAVDIGLDALRILGIKFPKKPAMFHVLTGLIKTMFLLKNTKVNELLLLPVMKDPLMSAGMRLLASMGSIMYWVQPEYIPLIIFTCMGIIIKYGNCAESPFTYSSYGLLLCSIGKIDSGYYYGKMGLQLLDMMNIKDQEPRTHFSMNTFVRHWKEHLRETIEPLYSAFKKGLEVGDLEFTGHSIMLNLAHKFYCGYEMKGLEIEMETLSAAVKKIKQEPQLHIMNMFHQIVVNHLRNPEKPYLIKGNIYNTDTMIPVHKKANDRLALGDVFLLGMMQSYFFNEYQLAFENLKKLNLYLDTMIGLYQYTIVIFYDSLTRLAMYESLSWFEKKWTLNKVSKNLRQIKKWMKYNPENQSNKFYLVQAEYMRVIGKDLQALTYFNTSIECARKNKFIHEEGIAHERAAALFLKKNEMFYAIAHIQAAHDCYYRWGAASKVKQLEEKYGRMLNKYSTTSGELIVDDDSMTTSGSRRITDTLDLSTVIKFSQAIASETELEKLLEKLMKMVIENAGAQRGFLIFENDFDKRLYVEAEGSAGKETTLPEPILLENNDNLSQAIVNYVNKSSSNVVLHNACVEGDFINDPYISNNRVKSLLCMPITYIGKTSGILYLENNLSTHTFTPERIELLNILSAQAAISIMNARLILHRENSAKLEKEIEIAANIQTGLLPQNPKIKDYEIVAYMKPADEIGGDYYDFIHAGGRDWLIIGDVSGHGIPAGLIMMMVQSIIQALVRKEPDIAPAELLMAVNNAMKHNIKQLNENKYMTITALKFLPDGSIVHAGRHEDIIVYRTRTGTIELFESYGLWLGLFFDSPHCKENSTLQMGPGDVMLLYTDGITEARDKALQEAPLRGDEDMYGKKRLIDIFSSCATLPVEKIKEVIIHSLEENYGPHDDVTLIVVKRMQ